MSSKWGSFPFCNAPFMTDAEQLQGRYPVPFTATQIMAALDRNTWDFSITGVMSLEDAAVEIIGAMALLSFGTLAGLGIAVAPIVASAANRTHVDGTMMRRHDASLCLGTKFVFNQNLCYIEINLGDVRRRQLGNTTLYYPRIITIFYVSGYVWANDLTFLQGAGEAVGGIDVVGSSGGISTMYVVTGNGAPVGSPSLFGSITPGENIDLMDFTPRSTVTGADVAITGITFAPITEVWFGGGPSAVVTQSTDRKRVTARVPAGATRDYIVLRGGEFEYATRIPFIPA